jgi:hypothetical protein
VDVQLDLLQDERPISIKHFFSKNGWFTDIAAVQHAWGPVKEAGFDYLKI